MSLPKGKTSNSSRRIHAANNVGLIAPRTKKQRRKINAKRKKLEQELHKISPSVAQKNVITMNDINDTHYFFDGGDDNATRINPPQLTYFDKKEKVNITIPVVTYRVVESLRVLKPKEEKGMRMMKSDGTRELFILVPRQYSLEAFHELGISIEDVLHAFDVAIANSNDMSNQRGKGISIQNADEARVVKYACVGSSAKRAGVGVWPLHHAIRKMDLEQQRILLRYMEDVIERMFRDWMPPEATRQMEKAMELINPTLFTTTDGESSEIYQAFAVGKNVYLSTHIDKDYAYSAIVILTRGKYEFEAEPVAYFTFPKSGVAVPLRPGDVLFFDASEPHSVSSRCRDSDDIYCISFYLKSSQVGKNDNGESLTEEQEKHAP